MTDDLIRKLQRPHPELPAWAMDLMAEAATMLEVLEQEAAAASSEATYANQFVISSTERETLERAVATIQYCGDSAVTEVLGSRLCCNEHHCGCEGRTVEDFIVGAIRALIKEK